MIYMDHSATTPLDARVLATMQPFFAGDFGNSMAIHHWGRAAEAAIEDARHTIARLLNCAPGDVVFTSGGSESDNLALRGPAQYASAHNRPFTLITSAIEHKAISVTARQLQHTLGINLRLLPVTRTGAVDPDDLRHTLHGLPTDGVALVSLIHAHNELGTINAIAECAAIAHNFGALFHTDAVQSPGHVPVDVNALDVDLLSLSTHKFYGPKGMGVLIVRDGVDLLSAQTGAAHENGLRAGTHNTPGIVGTAAALELATAEQPAETRRLAALCDRLLAEIPERVPDAIVTGDELNRLPHLASFAFKDVDSNTLLMHLDRRGIAASSGSACQVGNSQPSPILEALGLGQDWTRGGLRLSLGRATTLAEIDAVLEAVPEAVDRARRVHALSL